MARYQAEPAFAHDGESRIGILLVNLGTPDAPTLAAVRRYLAEFLSDPRVVEIPSLLWKPLLHGPILRWRPRRSAARYALIWSPDGSPLLVHSQRQRTLLRGYLGEKLKTLGLPADFCRIELGMRYGNPSIASAIDGLREGGVTKILVLPLYPQYAASTTASAFDAVTACLARLRRVPGMRFVESFHDDPGYVKAMARVVGNYWEKHGRPERLVLSFHGVPRRTLALGDPYHCHCHATGRLLARELGLSANEWVLTFQSRFGRGEWLKPYTADRLAALAKEGIERVDVFCPGFVSDCLETLEEIAIEGRAIFTKAGGKELRAIPCLNEHPAWIATLADVALRNLHGWLHAPPDADARALTLARAKSLGAKA